MSHFSSLQPGSTCPQFPCAQSWLLGTYPRLGVCPFLGGSGTASQALSGSPHFQTWEPLTLAPPCFFGRPGIWRAKGSAGSLRKVFPAQIPKCQLSWTQLQAAGTILPGSHIMSFWGILHLAHMSSPLPFSLKSQSSVGPQHPMSKAPLVVPPPLVNLPPRGFSDSVRLHLCCPAGVHSARLLCVGSLVGSLSVDIGV